jgi:hypothetical protein
MKKILIFTAGRQDARNNLKKSISAPIDESIVYDTFQPKLHGELKKLLEDNNGFYAWGFVPGSQNQRRWNTMKDGDYILAVYDNAYHYVANIVAKYHNAVFSKQVWGNDNKGNTWEYMFFLSKPRKIEVLVASKTTYLSSYYMGSFNLSDAKIARIVQDFGSVDAFIATFYDRENIAAEAL